MYIVPFIPKDPKALYCFGHTAPSKGSQQAQNSLYNSRSIKTPINPTLLGQSCLFIWDLGVLCTYFVLSLCQSKCLSILPLESVWGRLLAQLKRLCVFLSHFITHKPLFKVKVRHNVTGDNIAMSPMSWLPCSQKSLLWPLRGQHWEHDLRSLTNLCGCQNHREQGREGQMWGKGRAPLHCSGWNYSKWSRLKKGARKQSNQIFRNANHCCHKLRRVWFSKHDPYLCDGREGNVENVCFKGQGLYGLFYVHRE